MNAVRHGGSRLLFFTIADRHQSVQIICSLSSVATSGVTEDDFKRFSQVVRKGDWFCKSISSPAFGSKVDKKAPES